MKKFLLTALTLSAISFPGLAADTPPTSAPQKTAPQAVRQKLFNAEPFTLTNGMQVVVIPNHRAPVGLEMVWYKVGSSDEISGKTGIAHFLEHLMFKGSPHVPPGELSKRVRSMGGNDNAFTTNDFTAYFQTVSIAHLEDVMMLEADRMRGILVPLDQFESERQVVLEERRQRTENDPRSYFFDQLRYALFPAHPYSIPIIGWKQDIEKLTREDALAWHDKFYAPNNAILIVTGDITAAQLKPLAEKIYGSIPARPVVRAVLPPVSEFPGEVHLTLRDPRIRQSQLVRLYRVPGFVESKTESLALDLLEEIMSGNSSTRLYKSLVIEQKIATSASLGYQDTSRGTTILSASVSPAEGKTLEEVETAFDAEMTKLADKGVTPEELAAAKTRIRDSMAFTRDSLSDPAHIIGEALVNGIPLDDIEYWPDEIDSVTADQIKAVAQKYLIPPVHPDQKPNYVTGYVIAVKHKPGDPEPAALMPPRQEIR